MFDYGHYKIPQHLVAVTDPHFPCIVTHRGDNDTPRHAAETLRKRGMARAPANDVRRALERHSAIWKKRGSSFRPWPGSR